jgi:4-amino-4-deoxy-L-arabinose transferase-like glycosyltransferase
MGAENILAGEGFGRTNARAEVRPITMFAPFFSTVMAGFGLTGYLQDGTRIFQALLFGASIVLVGMIIYRLTGSIWASLTGEIILLVSKEVVLFHFWMMPEALYIFLTLLAIYLLVSFFETDQMPLLAMTGVVAGLATITRYVGVSMIATSVVAIMLLRSTSWKQRFVESIVVGGIGSAPFILWIGRNLLVSGDLVNRAIGFHPVPVELIRAYRAQISFWFVPEQLGLIHSIRRAIMVLLGLVAPVVYFGLALKDAIRGKNNQRAPYWTLPWILILYAAIYIITFVLNLTFLDALIDFDTVPRYLTPLYVICIPIFVLVFHGLAVRKREWWFARGFVVLMAIGLIGMYALNTLPIVRDPIPSLGYTGLKMERTETVEMLDSLSRSAYIISNDPELVYIFSDRTAFVLPIRYDANTGKEREDFNAQLEATREKLDAGGMLVIFTPIRDREIEVIDLLGVELIDTFYGSSFYAYPQAIEN